MRGRVRSIKVMQADYVLGYRVDKPTRCELPPIGAA